MKIRPRSIVAIAIAVASLATPHDFKAGLSLAGGTRHVQGDAKRPDVIVVLTDQQRADAFGAAGAADLHTPVMDRLARQGVVFTQAFAATPQCSPSRAALLTGRYPHRTGVMGNTGGGEGGGRVGERASGGRGGELAGTLGSGTSAGRAGGRQPAGMSAALERSLPTLGRVFAAAGYETAYFGKWHLGGTPGEYGFESHNSTISDSTLARHVVTFVQKRAANGARRPLFLVVSWLNPHDIYNVLTAAQPNAHALATARLPSNLVDDLRHKPFPQRHYLEEDQGKPFVGADQELWRRYRAFYNGLVEAVDREIGTVLDAFERSDVPPITVFSTDHGDHGGAHGLPYKGPAMYDEVVRVPLVISWPGRIRTARSDALVSLIDLLPTLCDLTGVPAPNGVDGLSLRPVLEQRAPQVLEWRGPLHPAELVARGAPTPRSAPLLLEWRGPLHPAELVARGAPTPRSAPRVRDMVFAEYYGKQSWRVPIRMVRTARWKYVRYLSYGEELYDLAADPGELRNLAREPRVASERTRLARELDDWIRRTDDPFPGLTTTDRSGSVVAPGQMK